MATTFVVTRSPRGGECCRWWSNVFIAHTPYWSFVEIIRLISYSISYADCWRIWSYGSEITRNGNRIIVNSSNWNPLEKSYEFVYRCCTTRYLLGIILVVRKIVVWWYIISWWQETEHVWRDVVAAVCIAWAPWVVWLNIRLWILSSLSDWTILWLLLVAKYSVWII